MKSEIRKRELRLNVGDFLYREGESPQSMFLLKSGVISIYAQKRGRAIELVRMQAGQLIGELAFFNREPRNASAKALTPSEILEIPFNDIQQEFEKFPSWVKIMLNTMSGQVVKFSRELKQFRLADEDQMATMNMNLLRFLGNLVLAEKMYGKKHDDGIWLNYADIRTVTAQISLLPFNKMSSVLDCLCRTTGFRKIEDHEGEFFIIEYPELLLLTVRMLDTHLLKSSGLIEPLPVEVSFLDALISLGRDLAADHRGLVSIPAPKIIAQLKGNGVQADLQVADKIISKGVAMEKLSSSDGVLLRYHQQETDDISAVWNLLSHLQAENPLKLEN